MRRVIALVVGGMLGCGHTDPAPVAAPPAAAAPSVVAAEERAVVEPPPKTPPPPDLRLARARVLAELVRPLHRPLTDDDRAGGWLDFRDEPGQTFDRWLARPPHVATPARHTIYVLPLGPLNKAKRRIVDKVTAFLPLYFGLPVTVLPPEPFGDVPAAAKRRHPEWGDRQIDTNWILKHRLRPMVPDDAAVLVALTAHDLWPGENWKGGGWNYLHGMANYEQRVGVWSLYRLGNAGKRRTLLRTLKTASHEIGHTFSMLHCTAYRCNLQGRLGVDESDRTPVALGPNCLAKLVYATGVEPLARFEKLAAWMKQEGFRREAAFFQRSADTLRAAGWDPADWPGAGYGVGVDPVARKPK